MSYTLDLKKYGLPEYRIIFKLLKEGRGTCQSNMPDFSIVYTIPQDPHKTPKSISKIAKYAEKLKLETDLKAGLLFVYGEKEAIKPFLNGVYNYFIRKIIKLDNIPVKISNPSPSQMEIELAKILERKKLKKQFKNAWPNGLKAMFEQTTSPVRSKTKIDIANSDDDECPSAPTSKM